MAYVCEVCVKSGEVCNMKTYKRANHLKVLQINYHSLSCITIKTIWNK